MYDQNGRGVVYSCGVYDDHSLGLVILSCPRITGLHVVYDLDGQSSLYGHDTILSCSASQHHWY